MTLFGATSLAQLTFSFLPQTIPRLMALVLFHTDKVRQSLKTPAALGVELFVLCAAAALIGTIVLTFQQWSRPYSQALVIDLSLWRLPKYTLMSLARGFAAYVISLAFTLIYGSIAAHHRRAEKVMVPLLDVFQAIPVLGFLPGLVLMLVNLFPHRQFGLELACILMIFTGQVWNMTFSYHASVRNIPSAMREVAAIQHFSAWQSFRWLELPASMIGLVWNSMMSMAGGWFFLTVNEAFTLGDHDYRLPGIGSYMSEAIYRGNHAAMYGAVAAMIVMIILVDQIVWRPIVVWSQRFKIEEQAGDDEARSWVLTLFHRSRLLARVGQWLRRNDKDSNAQLPAPVLHLRRHPQHWLRLLRLLGRLGRLSAMVLTGWLLIRGGWGLYKLLTALPLRQTAAGSAGWSTVLLALGASFLRTSTAVLLGAVWTLPVGIWIGRSRKWSQRFQPVIQVAASFPAPMLFPLAVLLLFWLKIPFTIGCIALMVLGTQWYILFNIVAGASAIPHDFTECADVYRMSRPQRWRRIYLPCVFPYLLTGLITAAGGAWNATIVSEYLQAGGHTLIAFGLGSIISKATAAGNFPLLAASVISMAAFVVLLNRFFWKRLYRLAEARYSLNA